MENELNTRINQETGERIYCSYDFCECDKCERTDCIVGMMCKSIVSIKRVPELEKKLNEMVHEDIK